MQIFKDKLKVQIFNSRLQMGKEAAAAVALKINTLLQLQSEINIIFAAVDVFGVFAALDHKPGGRIIHVSELSFFQHRTILAIAGCCNQQ